jgi:hypothetical protein
VAGKPGRIKGRRQAEIASPWVGGAFRSFEADRLGLPTAYKALRGITVADLRHPVAKTRLIDLTTEAVSAYSTERLARVRPSSLNRELDILRTPSIW